MLRTLYAKLAFGLLVLLIAIGAIYTAITLTVTDNYMRQLNQEINRDLARNLVADRNLVEEGRLNESALKETFSLYMSINPSIEIYLLDNAGRILSYSADPGKIKRKFVSLEPIKTFLRMEDPYPLLGDDPRSHDRQKAFSVTEIPGKTTSEGYLFVDGAKFAFGQYHAGVAPAGNKQAVDQIALVYVRVLADSNHAALDLV